VKINATGDLFVKRNITAYGNLTIGKASQNTESDTTPGLNINTTTIYGNFIVYPTVNDTDDYLKVNANNSSMELRSYGDDNFISTITVLATEAESSDITLKSTQTETINSRLNLRSDGFTLSNGITNDSSNKISIYSGNNSYDLTLKSYTNENSTRKIEFDGDSITLTSAGTGSSSSIELVDNGNLIIRSKFVAITSSDINTATQHVTIDANLYAKRNVTIGDAYTDTLTVNSTTTFAQSPLVPSKTTPATDDGTLIATEAQVYLKADIASPAFTGTPTVPSKTTPATDDGTLIATEAQVYLKADIATTYTKTEADSRYLNLSGGTMTGTITGAERSGMWIYTFTSNTAFYVPPNTDKIPGNSAQGVLSWRTGLGDGYCINNLSGDNRTHLQWTTKSNIDNGTNASNDVFWMENGIMYVPTPPLP
jgi:hypothetical protein